MCLTVTQSPCLGGAQPIISQAHPRSHLPPSKLTLTWHTHAPYDHRRYWKSVPHHTIVWVEPNPSLFAKLSANTAHIQNKVLLNKAARPLSMEGDTLTLHCWNTTMVSEVSVWSNRRNATQCTRARAHTHTHHTHTRL
jgi:hypothetical protein